MATAFDYSFNQSILEGLPDDVQNSIRKILQEAAQVRADTTDPLSSRAVSQRSQAELLEGQAARILMANRPDLKNITGGEDKDAIAQRKFNNPFYYALDENQKAAVDREFEAASEKVRLPRALQDLGIRYPAAAPQVFSSAEAAPEVSPVAAMPVAQAVSAPVVAPVQRSVQPSIAGLLASESVAPAAPAAPAARRSQSVEGLLGSLFGGNELEDLMTPQQRAAINQRGLLAAAAALLQAGGPSTRRVSLGQALGSALEAGQTGAERAQQSALTQMLTRQKLEEAKRSRDLQTNISRLLTGGSAPASAGGEITAGEALAAPGMAAGPTVARAAMIGQPRPEAPAMSANELKASQYRQIADVYAASGKGEDAKRFMDIAESLAPTRQEVVGEIYRGEGNRFFQRTKTGGVVEVPRQMAPAPKPLGSRETVTDLASGKQIIVQGYDDGSFKTIEGYGPKREMVLQTVDGKTVAIDKSKVVAGQTFGTGRDVRPVDFGGKIQFVDFNSVAPGTTLGKTLAPQVVGGAESGYYVLGGGSGAAPRIPAAAVPVTAPAAAPARAPAAGAAATAPAAAPAAGMQPIIPGTGPKPPEAFMKAAKQLSDLRGAIVDYKNTLDTTNWIYPANIPIPFTDRGFPLPVGEETTAVASRYNSLLMGVKNLYELGALAGPDMSIIERQLTNPASWAGLLTSRKGMNEQVKVLEDMLTRAEKNLESTYKQKIPEAAVTPVSPREGQVSKDKSGKDIVFRNNRWEYK